MVLKSTFFHFHIQVFAEVIPAGIIFLLSIVELPGLILDYQLALPWSVYSVNNANKNVLI